MAAPVQPAAAAAAALSAATAIPPPTSVQQKLEQLQARADSRYRPERAERPPHDYHADDDQDDGLGECRHVVVVGRGPQADESYVHQTGRRRALRVRRRPSGGRADVARGGWALSTTRPSSRAYPPCCRPPSRATRRNSTCVSTIY